MMADLASQIWNARKNGGHVAVSEIDAIGSRAAAYAIQAAGAKASGLTRAGWKVAATSGLAQELLGMEGPSIGPVFTELIHEPGDKLEVRPEQGTAVECEFAFVMGRNLGSSQEITRADVLAAIERAHIAIEVVGCRFEGGFKGAGSNLCISDFSFNVAFVPGPEIANWQDVDLKAATAKLLLNGDVANQGVGADVLGDPVEALCWAANEANGIGLPLRNGDVITTGTMTGATLVNPSDQVVGDFGDLGQVALSF